jgi:hypothetical protein
MVQLRLEAQGTGFGGQLASRLCGQFVSGEKKKMKVKTSYKLGIIRYKVRACIIEALLINN